MVRTYLIVRIHLDTEVKQAHLNNEDFLIRMSDRKRFKVTRFERNAVSEILLSHRVMARLLIPGTDSLISFP